MKYVAFLMAWLGVAQHAMAQEGYPGSWQLGLQNPSSPLKTQIDHFHDLLLWIIVAITVIVTLLLVYAVVKFRRRKNVEPATFAHNTLIEVLWTIIPVIILIVIAIPSFKLLFFENRIPEPEMTLKVTGYQWYWGYEYTDYDGLDFLSYPIADADIDADAGQKRLLSTDNPVVVPVDTNIQFLVTSADVIHAFAMPSAGVKKDAVPGRMNETWTRFDKEGTYFGQCSEICGTGHAYMPIEFKVVSKDAFEKWAKSKGGVRKVQNSETVKPDSVENKLDNPKVDADNVSNSGQ